MIGDVLIAKCWNWQMRKDIGHMKPSAPPSGVDYDTWVGPAEWMPFQANRFHYDWHWWYNFGCGDLGNDGIHEFDYALWGLGVETHPSIVSAAGGKYFFDDDQQFPDTQQVTFEYPGDGKVGSRKMLIYEHAAVVDDLSVQRRQRRRVLRHQGQDVHQQARQVRSPRRPQSSRWT